MRELRAEDRSFRRRLTPATIAAMRPRILSALWGIVTAWNLAGRPPASRMNTSFPEWCETIGGMVEFAGWGCPTAPAQIEGVGDTDTTDFAALAAAMKPGRRYEFDELATISEDTELFDHILSDKENGSLTRRAKKRLSEVFKRFSGRRVTASGHFEVLGKAKTRRYMINNGNDGNDGNDVSSLLENSTFSYGVKHHADHADHVAIDPEDAAEAF
jgi:hypothetical protein